MPKRLTLAQQYRKDYPARFWPKGQVIPMEVDCACGGGLICEGHRAKGWRIIGLNTLMYYPELDERVNAKVLCKHCDGKGYTLHAIKETNHLPRLRRRANRTRDKVPNRTPAVRKGTQSRHRDDRR